MAIPLTSLVRITLATLVLIATGLSVTSAETTVRQGVSMRVSVTEAISSCGGT